MKILFAAAEIFPFAKSGGLADMAYALPRAYEQLGHKTTALMPLYAFIDRDQYQIRSLHRSLTLNFGGKSYDVKLYACRYRNLDLLFLYHPILCDRPRLYGPPGGAYPDNDLRFAIFSHALVSLLREGSFDLLHLNDWHCALAALLAKEARSDTPIVYTIHNLAYQGVFPAESLERCGIGREHFRMEELEFYGQVNWMKAGIYWADAITTVSPSYAREILTPEFGCALEGFLRVHRKKLRGILNGIDYEIFDPSSDPALPSLYDSHNPRGKMQCKAAYLREIGMNERENLPLFIFIGRFVEQKGIHWIAEAMEKIAALPLSLAILGDGSESFDRHLAQRVRCAANVHLSFGYDESLSHRMYAAADFLLMPSTFEACGLNQMIAMRYGTIPIVHRVGGLRDTVHPPGSGVCGEGIGFDGHGPDAVVAALQTALELYRDDARLEALRRFDMECDFSIERCAREYLRLFASLDRNLPAEGNKASLR